MAEQLVWNGVTKENEQELVKYFGECFTVDESCGDLIWKVRPRWHFIRSCDWNRHINTLAGIIAGHVKKGRYTYYRRVKLLGSTIECHTICWTLYYGRFPEGHIDHIDGDGLNNSKVNLRDHSNEKNKQLSVKNKSGVVGVYWHEGLQVWRATGGRNQIGSSKDLFESVCTRRSWELKNGYTPR